MSRSAWLYRDSQPDYGKISRYRLDTVYIDPLSSNAAAVVADLKAHGVQPAVYVAQSWQPGMSGAQFADWASKVLNELAPRPANSVAPPAMLDLEVGSNVAWAVECITRYRQHQPARPTSYTNAPFQGGYVPVAALKAASMPFYVQTYYGNMLPADAAAAILEAARDYDPRMIFPFYDGATVTGDQRDGCWFTLERMP